MCLQITSSPAERAPFSTRHGFARPQGEGQYAPLKLGLTASVGRSLLSQTSSTANAVPLPLIGEGNNRSAWGLPGSMPASEALPRCREAGHSKARPLYRARFCLPLEGKGDRFAVDEVQLKVTLDRGQIILFTQPGGAKPIAATETYARRLAAARVGWRGLPLHTITGADSGFRRTANLHPRRAAGAGLNFAVILLPKAPDIGRDHLIPRGAGPLQHKARLRTPSRGRTIRPA